MTTVTLLGPQRLAPCLDTVLAARAIEGPLALITAGWEELEQEDGELTEHLGVETVNLRLFGRTEEVFALDDELYQALFARRERLRGLQRVYRMRLRHALEAARDLFSREGDAELLVPERADALAAVTALDEHHLARVQAVHAEFEEQWKPAERPEMARHSQEVAAALGACAGVAIAGGHVVVLLNRLRLFNLATPLQGLTLLAWSAGAMALTEKVIAFHDSPPQGPGNPEVLEAGLGIVPGIVALPSARRRLKLHDPVRVALLARRFAPSACIALDESDHVGLRLDAPGTLLAGGGARRLQPTGEVERMVAS